MAVPFRIGVMQLTMEPLDEMLASSGSMVSCITPMRNGTANEPT